MNIQPKKWLNKNITALGLVSLLNDFGNEMARNLVPAFLLSIGESPTMLGMIEGFSDASVSIMKIFAGWYSDTLGKRKPFALIGYALGAFGVSLFPFASKWYHVLYAQTLGRLGKGIREPARDALIVESTKPQFYGRIFGFHRALDTIGAICGPLTAFFLMHILDLHTIFIIALIPCVLSVLTILFFVQEPPTLYKLEQPILSSISSLTKSFKKFLGATLIFSLGNFATPMLILRATQLLEPAKGTIGAGSLALLLYTLHNVVYATCSYPIGKLTDSIGKKYILMCGYVLTGITSLLFAIPTTHIVLLSLFFMFAGICAAITDAVQRSAAADLLPVDMRGTGYGALALITGIGNLVSNVTVGYLWTNVSPMIGFGYSAALCFAGGLSLLAVSKK